MNSIRAKEPSVPHRTDKQVVAGHFSRHAAHYSKEAWIQQQMQRFLWDWYLQESCRSGEGGTFNIVDIGCGPGNALDSMALAIADLDYLGVDLSQEMTLKANEHFSQWIAGHPDRQGQVRATFVVADAEAMHWAAESYDLIHANAVMQWFANPIQSVHAWLDALKPGGWMAIAVFGKGTFHELREAAKRVVSAGENVPGPVMFDLSTWESMLKPVCAGRADLKIISRSIPIQYPDVYALLKHIQRMGATDATAEDAGRIRWTPRKLKALEAAYLSNGANEQGISATYEQIFWLIRKHTHKK